MSTQVTQSSPAVPPYAAPAQQTAPTPNPADFSRRQAGPRRGSALAADAARHGLALVSGVPRQAMRSWASCSTVPMINMLLIGYLPVGRMRRTTQPSLGAACGQLMLVEWDFPTTKRRSL